jgi:mRNA-degrading endonuclease RelE of RelBE toxin-antitoxin system
LRIGDYRLLYEIHATEVVIYVLGVAHRRDVYVRLLRRR